jgi:hypothetical protein
MSISKLATAGALVIMAAALVGCGGGQAQAEHLETRPLEESKALEIIAEVASERGYTLLQDVKVELTTDSRFPCDFRVSDHKIAIEYVTAKDRGDIGHIPPAASGSRLHVVPGRAVAEDPHVPGEPIYIYFIDERKYVYHYNPTSEVRADVTYLEVDSRMRRDLADFLSWYETQRANEKQ